MVLMLGHAALRLFVFLHCSALFLAFPLHGFPVLFGSFASHAGIVLGAGIILSSCRQGAGDAYGEEQEESCDSFHGVSDGDLR